MKSIFTKIDFILNPIIINTKQLTSTCLVKIRGLLSYTSLKIIHELMVNTIIPSMCLPNNQ